MPGKPILSLTLLAAFAPVFLPAAWGRSVALVPVADAVPASAGTDIGLRIEESRGLFHFTFSNRSALPSSALKIAFEPDLLGRLGSPVRGRSASAPVSDRSAGVTDSLAPAAWEGSDTFLAPAKFKPARGIAVDDAFVLSFRKHGLTLDELMARLTTVGYRVGVVLAHEENGLDAWITALPSDPGFATAEPPILPPHPPAPTPAPTPGAAAFALALLARYTIRRPH